MKTKTTAKATKGQRAQKVDIRTLWNDAHAQGRAVLTHEEFLLLASLAGLTERDIRNALTDEVIRRGVTGYWVKEAADPGAIMIFQSAMRATSDEQEAA